MKKTIIPLRKDKRENNKKKQHSNYSIKINSKLCLKAWENYHQL